MTRSRTPFARAPTAAALALAVALAAAAPAAAETFTNSEQITIAADYGKATPYPSTIEVSGLGGIVTDVDVTLHEAVHQHFEDFDIVLVSPTGRRVLLASDTCAGEVDATLTLDEDADVLPESAPCQSARYAPADYEPEGDVDEADPAPDGSGLDDLTDEDPNGTWELYVYDDRETSPDDGRIEGGWSLDIEVRDPAPVAFTTTNLTVLEGATAVVEVVRSGTGLYEGSVTVATSSGTAFAGADFAPVGVRLDFASGETTKRVEVPVFADGLGENAQDFSIVLGNPEGDASVGTPGAVGVAIPADPGGAPDDLPRGNEDPPPPSPFSASNAFRSAPRSRRCRRAGQVIRFRPRMPQGVAIVRSELFVNGRKVEDNIDEAAVAPIVVTMRGRRMRVRVRLRAHDGRIITIRRTFRRCSRKTR